MSRDMACVRLADALIDLRKDEEEHSAYFAAREDAGGGISSCFEYREDLFVKTVQRYMDREGVTLLDFYNIMRDPESFLK